MSRVTPPLRVKGTFQLRLPFVADPSTSYTVTAIRTFEEIRARSTDPMALVYTPVGLLPTDYALDVSDGAVIVTLMSANGKPIYVPDTYIVAYPDMGAIEYSHWVISASLGPLPSKFDTTLLEAQVAAVISDYIGVVPVINVGRAELLDVVSQTEHDQLQAAREGNIVNRKTDRARAIAAETLVAEQLLRIQALEQMITEMQSP